MKLLWVLVNCNSVKEADKVGKAVLKERLASCFDIFPRYLARYFWPPRSGKIETTKGCLLILETLPKAFKRLEKVVRKLHSDKLPFIGSININRVDSRYIRWLENELKRE